MELVEKTLKVPKELLDIEVALVELVKDIVAKKSLALVAGENLPLLMTAIEGYEKIGEEFKSEFGPNVIALLAAEMYAALQKKAEVVPQA